jgi:hypothetical protein
MKFTLAGTGINVKPCAGRQVPADGSTDIHPEPARFFETPIHLPLPEDLNFIP